jgi:crotonobetainyl-CoA:carnitine CoA-transferase CaiB-like acyl-CoA transferase
MQKTFLRREGRNRWQVATKDGGISLPSLWECKDGAVAFFMLLGPSSAGSNTALVEWMKKDGIDPGVLGRWDWNTMDWSNFTVEDAKEVAKSFQKLFMKHTMMELLQGALKYDIQITPLLKPKDQLKFPQFVERKFFIEVEHPDLNKKIIYPGGFAKFSEASCGIRFCAPLIGEHNDEIYRKELGLSSEELVALKQCRVI